MSAWGAHRCGAGVHGVREPAAARGRRFFSATASCRSTHPGRCRAAPDLRSRRCPSSSPSWSSPRPASAGWRAPVDGGAVLAPFALRPRAAVRPGRAARRRTCARRPARRCGRRCGGVVTFAGRVPRFGGAVTHPLRARCAATVLGLRSPAVRRGAVVLPGRRLGAARGGVVRLGARTRRATASATATPCRSSARRAARCRSARRRGPPSPAAAAGRAAAAPARRRRRLRPAARPARAARGLARPGAGGDLARRGRDAARAAPPRLARRASGRIASAQRVAFYVTTPIYYVNAAPHLGHAYTTIGSRHRRAPHAPARRGRLLPHGHRRARRAGRGRRRARGRHAAGARRPQRRSASRT